MGFPLLISKMLSHADFAGIQAGDSAEKGRAIDPVMSVYEDMFFNVYKWNSVASESKRKENDPVATIHYLRDGLLKIEYDIVDDNTLVVTDLIFEPNYNLTNLFGEPITTASSRRTCRRDNKKRRHLGAFISRIR